MEETNGRAWAGLERAGCAGRKSRLSQAELKKIERKLKEGPEAFGYETGLWTLQRVAELLEQECGIHYHPGHVGWLLGKMGWSCQRLTGRALERDELSIERWKKNRYPKLKKAQREGRTIVFVDESGLSQRPTVAGPGRQCCSMPLKEQAFGDAGVTWWNFYFRLYPGSVRSPQVVEFLSHFDAP